LGYILLGFGLGFAYGSEMGFMGGTFHIMTHAFMKGLAFLAAGAIIYRIGTRDIKKMRGIGHAMPITALAFTVAALSLSGAPPLSGFMSEWMIFKAGVDVVPNIGFWGIAISMILLLNSALSLGYYLPIIKGFFLKPRRNWVGIKETPMMMLIPLIILMAITITLGIWPELGLQVVKPVVDFLMGLGGA
jgi:NADH:ubiquinone oxidoreductase subunit 5 (subunit L)/multisubunit Na+/H+ antiporter MnhA subunit